MNIRQEVYIGEQQSFNRYMVECEFSSSLLLSQKKPVLIDTWWNVNQDILTREEFGHWGFNRYMVECEFKRMFLT